MKNSLVLQKQVYASEADLIFCSENLPLTTTQKGEQLMEQHLLRRKAYLYQNKFAQSSIF
jgi:hypothetical protein